MDRLFEFAHAVLEYHFPAFLSPSDLATLSCANRQWRSLLQQRRPWDICLRSCYGDVIPQNVVRCASEILHSNTRFAEAKAEPTPKQLAVFLKVSTRLFVLSQMEWSNTLLGKFFAEPPTLGPNSTLSARQNQAAAANEQFETEMKQTTEFSARFLRAHAAGVGSETVSHFLFSNAVCK